MMAVVTANTFSLQKRTAVGKKEWAVHSCTWLPAMGRCSRIHQIHNDHHFAHDLHMVGHSG
jgi:hypothetical protein